MELSDLKKKKSYKIKKHQCGQRKEKDQKIFLNENHFISLTAKKSNTVNYTLNICVEHLFVPLIKKNHL